MPTFYEVDEDRYDAGVQDVDDEQPTESHASRPRPPVSAPASSQPSSSKPHLTSRKPHSSVVSGSKPRLYDTSSEPQETEEFPCPLCNSKFIDNARLNEHIDWCLSREAIRNAQADVGKQTTSDDRNTSEYKEAQEVKDAKHKEWWKSVGLSDQSTKKTKRKRGR